MEWWQTQNHFQSHHTVRRVDWRNIPASFITFRGVMPEELLLHQSSVSTDWWLMQDSCLSYQSVRSNAWRNTTSKVITLCGRFIWLIIITSVITVCAEMTDTRLLHQSSLYWMITVITIRSDDTHGKCANHHCVRTEGWSTITPSIVTLNGEVTDE